MSIVVHGEHYDSIEDLGAAILKLRGELDNMPQHTPEHEALAQHVARLSEAYLDRTGQEPEADATASVGSEPPQVAEDDEVQSAASGATKDEQTKEDEGNYCPICGHELDHEFPVPFDPTTKQCPNCQGFGKTLTGSRVAGHVVRDCQLCQGQGWIQDAAAAPIIPAAEPVAEQAVWPDSRKGSDGLWLPAIGQAPPWEGATWNPRTGGWQ